MFLRLLVTDADRYPGMVFLSRIEVETAMYDRHRGFTQVLPCGPHINNHAHFSASPGVCLRQYAYTGYF